MRAYSLIAILVAQFAFASELGIHAERTPIKSPPPVKAKEIPESMRTIDDCVSENSHKPSICGFRMVPGDRRVHILDVEAGESFPFTPLNSVIVRYRVYYSTKGFPVPGDNDTHFTVINVVPEANEGLYSLEPNFIAKLENGIPYYFRFSAIDDHGRELYMTSDMAIVNECGSMTPLPPFDGTNGGSLCSFAAVPGTR